MYFYSHFKDRQTKAQGSLALVLCNITLENRCEREKLYHKYHIIGAVTFLQDLYLQNSFTCTGPDPQKKKEENQEMRSEGKEDVLRHFQAPGMCFI